MPTWEWLWITVSIVIVVAVLAIAAKVATLRRHGVSGAPRG